MNDARTSNANEPGERARASGVGIMGPRERARWGVRGGRAPRINIGAGNGIRTRDFDLGKVALYH